MIISASRRTDIPAFYGKYFYSCLKNKSFKVQNPFNKKISIIKFNDYNEIDGIVFWTKNPKNFFKELKYIKLLNIPFYFQFTLNNYPRNIEPNLPLLNERVSILKELNILINPFKIIWRYDPIILTKNFNFNFHTENFESILEKIKDEIYEIIISILTPYRKIKKNFLDIVKDKNKEIELLKEIDEISKKYGKKISLCCYENLKSLKIPNSKCIDGAFFNKNKDFKKHYGQRNLCNCDKSIDIGFYRTCKHNCLYCYAN